MGGKVAVGNLIHQLINASPFQVLSPLVDRPTVRGDWASYLLELPTSTVREGFASSLADTIRQVPAAGRTKRPQIAKGRKQGLNPPLGNLELFATKLN